MDGLKLESWRLVDWRGVGLDVAELLGVEWSHVAQFSHMQWQVDVRLLHEPVEASATADFSHRQAKDVASREVGQPEHHSNKLPAVVKR